MSIYRGDLSPGARARTLALSYANPEREPKLFNFMYETLLRAFRNEPVRLQTMEEVRAGIKWKGK